MENIIDDISKSNEPKRVFRIKHKQMFGMTTNKLAQHESLGQGNAINGYRKNLGNENKVLLESMYKMRDNGKYKPCQTISSCDYTHKNQ